jgi:hypothetical protein
LRHARAAIRNGNDTVAAALFRRSTGVLLGEPSAEPAPVDNTAAVDPETLKRREIAKAQAAVVLTGFGQTRR